MTEKKYITFWDFYEWATRYKERFDEHFGTYEWSLRGDKLGKAIELIQRALNRGSPVTDEEYYKELVGISDEMFKAFKRGELLF